ncbi:ABC transporter permease [Streptomyces phytophilus]|uniref:ABC transporter permease n=1 Tax=Streptomyces phytophilus TaxID=722715 RepID=UPI0015F005EA|nr:ABC transporter permease [Streptomyces phytophilus]
MTAPPLLADAPGRTPAAGAPRSDRTGGSTAATVLRYAATPVVLGLVLAVLAVYVSRQDLDLIEQRSLNSEYLVSRTLQHLELTALATVLILAIALPLGVLLTRSRARRFAGAILAVVSIAQALPSIGLIVLLAVGFVSLGVTQIALIAFVAYGVLPVLRNTIAGLQQVDAPVIESARGMGMTPGGILWRIELPLAAPVMLAGIRTALVITVGTVALATFIGAGGLGDVISNGINSSRTLVLVTGSTLVAVLALLIDWLAGIAEDLLRPRGL